MTENNIGVLLIRSAVDTCRELGPGLLESVDEVVLAVEFSRCANGLEETLLKAQPSASSRFYGKTLSGGAV